MTRVCLEKDGNRYTVSARGHATGSAEACAAVSAIIYALAGYITNEREKIEIETVKLESGDALLCFHGGAEAEAAYWMAAIGLMQVEAAAREHLEVDQKNTL